MRQSGAVEALWQRYKGKAEFLLVYVREAHPNLIKEEDVPGGEAATPPKTLAQRAALAKKLYDVTKITLPCVLDLMDDAVDRAYAARPDRICIVDIDGKVGYYSGPGPGGFKPREAQAALEKILANDGRMVETE
ncbi:MAG TPA: deiodinase-like protein [Planctomycetota bacterium]|nr:deiodinase-like protein [Planctomycetota bacterium]